MFDGQTLTIHKAVKIPVVEKRYRPSIPGVDFG